MKKLRNWSLLMKIIFTVPKVLFFKTTDLYTVYLFWISRQLKHHKRRIRSEISILLEVILNAFNVWQYHFRPKFLFWLLRRFYLFQFAFTVNLLFCYMCTFYWPLRKKRCTILPVGTNVHVCQHIHQKI